MELTGQLMDATSESNGVPLTARVDPRGRSAQKAGATAGAQRLG